MHICLILGNTHPNKKLGLNVGGIANQILLLLPSYEKINDIKISLITKYTEYKPSSTKINIYEIHKYNKFLLDTIYFFLKSPLAIIKIHKADPINIINFHNSTYFYSFIIILRLLYKIPILMKIPLDFTSFLRDTSMPKENKIRTRILNYSWFKFFKRFILKKLNFIRAIKFIYLIEDDGLRKKLGDNGLKKIHKKFLWKDIMSNFNNDLNQVHLNNNL